MLQPAVMHAVFKDDKLRIREHMVAFRGGFRIHNIMISMDIQYRCGECSQIVFDVVIEPADRLLKDSPYSFLRNETRSFYVRGLDMHRHKAWHKYHQMNAPLK